MPSDRYHLHVHWRARPESTRTCAARLAHMLAGLVTAHPSFAHWNNKGVSRAAANEPAWNMPPKVDELVRVFEDGRRFKDAPREPWPEMGYVVTAWNGLYRPYGASLAMWPGAYGDWLPLPNHVDLDLARVTPVNKDLMSAEVLKQVFLSLATAWEPDYGNVVSRDYWQRSFRGRYPLFRSGWMTYLAAQYASRVTPPPAAIVERVAGGGMLLLATEERFSMDNPAHLTVADAIQAALAPLQEMAAPGSAAPSM